MYFGIAWKGFKRGLSIELNYGKEVIEVDEENPPEEPKQRIGFSQSSTEMAQEYDNPGNGSGL